MEKLYYKVSRDPIQSEIFLYPLEIVISDTQAMQRLRYLSQLAGAEYVYPSATHTRFSHSLGVMHLSGVYSQHIYPENHSKFRILRLAGLLHDIGHGPYSHQFDDAVYKKMGYKDGHDEYREKILKTKLIEEIIEEYKNLNDPRTKNDFFKDLALTINKEVNEENLKESIEQLINMVLEVYEGEYTGSIDFNIVQGPLGADRLDFVLRDSYYAGTRHFGTGAVDRLIRNTEIFEDGKICYSIKVIDDIYSSLFARFMMYKNVYFHKTSRAADQMLQEILKYAYDILHLKERVENLDTFITLTDEKIINEIELIYDILYGENLMSLPVSPEWVENSEKIANAHNLINRLKKRDLWKIIVEIPFSMTGVDPSVVSVSVAQNILNKIKENLQNKMKEDIKKEDKEEITYILNNFDYLFKIDTPYKLSVVHPSEFLASDVFIKDTNGDILGFDEVYERYPALKLLESNLIQIVRIYIKEDKRELLKKYNIVPQFSNTKTTTRW
ncbi:metal-dependent phosphohydrolase [Tepiditoga spiralis]|uniref:Metal-dependent phosphohydrolase n=1 Tax=Tepiditoga spiralis TaxID=2108365 RepID=A0A7G1G404_9BACT|nr:HD domain-containing protein [Tepiditoga spiralis]BBE31200.1 metal-dependent phosphohydrolase [Tepiditoga spiralis]